jgi:hypothetical protein
MLPVKGQKSVNDEKLNQARLLLYDYRDASLFRDMNTGKYDPSWEGIFRNAFATGSRIVFDVPFRKKPAPIETEPQTINKYLELVTPDQYIEIIRKGYDVHNITNFAFDFIETGFDTTDMIKNNRLQFEISKIFNDTRWSLDDAVNYVVEIKFFQDQPKITSIRLVDENISKSNVSVTFYNNDLSEDDYGYRVMFLLAHVSFSFDENVIRRNLTLQTDSDGKIDLGLIPNRATLRIDSIKDHEGIDFFIPADWRITGKTIISQPSDGFKVSLQPWKWNGFSWSVRGFGGIIGQSQNQLTNFSSESTFDNQIGSKFGFGLEASKLFTIRHILNSLGKWLPTSDPVRITARRNTYLGGGVGISYYQYKYKITSNEFNQNPYDFTDRLGTPVEVIASGSNYTEIISSNGVMLPIFFEIRKNFVHKTRKLQAISLQGGLNLTVPFETEYDLIGQFSRYGRYNQFNPQPITDDPFYNYYSNSNKEIEGVFQDKPITKELIFRFNGYFDFFGNKSDNLLDVGLIFSFPLNSSTQTDDFYLVAGNDEFGALSNSKNKIYNYFIGLSVGYNFINYRLY